MRSKKMFVSIASAILLSLVLAVSCDIPDIPTNPSDFTYTNKDEMVSIDGPSNVRAVAYDYGVIAVSWDPVKDAKSYDVYRRISQDASGDTIADYTAKFMANIALESISAGTSLGYVDTVSFSNQLKDGVTYEYTVVANSGNSTSGRAVSKDYFVQNGSSTVTVTAKVPAQGTRIAKPAFELNPIIGYNSNAYEYLQVLFNAIPGIDYKVSYSYGSAAGPRLFNASADVSGDITNQAVEVKLPLINGKLSVRVVAVRDDNYYAASDTGIATYDGVKTLIATPDLTAVSLGDGRVSLSWNATQEADAYEVYRFTASSDFTFDDSTDVSNGYLLGDWTAITNNIGWQKDPSIGTYGGYKGYDNILNIKGEKFYYMLVATKGTTASSEPFVTLLINNQFTAPSLTVGLVNGTAWDTFYNRYNSIQISFTTKADQTYTLYRMPLTVDGDSAEGDWAPTDWTEVSTTINKTPVGQTAVVVDTPTLRHSYRYKLVATQGGVTMESVANINAYPYATDKINVGFAVNNTNFDGDRAYYTTVNISTDYKQVVPLMADDDKLVISRAKSDVSGNVIGDWIAPENLTLTKNDINNIKIVDAISEGGYYRYKLEIFDKDGKLLKNDVTSYVVSSTSYTDPFSFTNSFDPPPVGSGKQFVFETVPEADDNAYINGIKMIFRYTDVVATSQTAEQDALDAIAGGKYTDYNLTLSKDATLVSTYRTNNIGLPGTGNARFGILYIINGAGERVNKGTFEVN